MPIPNGQLVPRHFQNFEGEMYLQDKWNVTPNSGGDLRRSATRCLQPPFENTGNQVAPTVDMDQWFKNRGPRCYQGSCGPARLDFRSFRAGQRRQALLGMGLQESGAPALRSPIRRTPPAASGTRYSAMPARVPFAPATAFTSIISAKASSTRSTATVPGA